MFEGYSDSYNETVRLTVLKALAEETDYRLNDTMLMAVLQAFAINRSRDYLRNELSWLETEVQAVKLTKAGTAVIAELTERGLDHVERRVVLTGVRKPSPALL
ncbi:hypothetical protein H1D41_17230 [Rhodobacteraceae bacterium MYP1-1]|uniref:Uncharacterized protein n=2 Tax=Halocynthiibacter styelae TaxID=2761955 RepID=A0A8J7IEA8_9RHOB|nr:hypothetical protein [Paenihalocynthiibacter styelae]